MKKLLLLALVLLIATTAFAQNRGRIVGTLTTADGAVIAGATVTITSDALISSSLTTTSNERGMFRFVLLPVGSFSMKIEKEGYKTIEQSDLNVGYDVTLTLNKVMSASDFEEVITITGEAPIVDKTSSTIGDKLDVSFLQNQPSQRNVWALPNLSAGFNDNSGMGGVADSGNAYNADGVNISDPATGTVFSDVNMEAVEQVDVSLFGANAEYGGFTGASMNVVTKSGGNEFHGEANYFAQRVDWADDNTENYDLIGTPTASDLNEFNGSLGGPLVKDQIWFFGNFKYAKWETAREIKTGPITVTEDPRRYFGKVSARWDDKNITYGSYTYYERMRSHRIWFGGWLNNTEDSMWEQPSDSKTLLLQHSYVFNDNLIGEARFAYFRGGFDLLPKNYGPIKYEVTTGQFTDDSQMAYHTEYKRNRDDLLLTASYYNDNWGGSHSFKFGAEWERSSSWRYFDMQELGYYYGGEKYYRWDWGVFTSDTQVIRYAGFVQDSWSVDEKLTINYGVRIDRTGWKPGDDTDAPLGRDEFMDYFEVAPRIGFAYDISGDGKTIVRAFVGRFYEGITTGNTEAMVCTFPPDKLYYGSAILGPSVGDDWVLVDVSGGSGNFSIDPDINNQYTEGLTFGIEREVMPNIGASATFTYKRDRNMFGTIAPEMTYDTETLNQFGYSGPAYYNIVSGAPQYYTNPQKGDPGVLEDLTRTYWSAMFEVNKRMSDNWSMKANYTYSRNEGTVGNGDYGVIQGFTLYSDPNSWINTGGRLSIERPHAAKLSGTYIAPFDVYISPAITYLSGTAYADYFNYNDSTIQIAKNEGDDRYDSQFNIDLRIEKAFMLMEKYRVGFIVDIFNLTNSDAVTGWSNDVESTRYHIPTSIVGPRFYQAGIRLIF